MQISTETETEIYEADPAQSAVTEAKAALEALRQARAADDQPDNTPGGMAQLVEIEKAANRVEHLTQRAPFASMDDAGVALKLEDTLVSLDESRAALAAAEGPGQRARAERLISEAEAAIPLMQLELKRRQDDAANSASLDRFADRVARQQRHERIAEFDREIAKERKRMDRAYASAEPSFDFSHMRKLAAARDALADAARSDSAPTADELARVKEEWQGLNHGGSVVQT